MKQGCVLAPVLFNMFFSQVLLHTVKDLDVGVYVRCRSDGSVFDLRRLSAQTKALKNFVIEALFADNCTLMAHRESHLQAIVDCFAEASRLHGLTISLGKAEVLVQSASNTIDPQPNITIEGFKLKCVESFKNLGSTIPADGFLDSEISSRMHKASQALGRMKVKLLQQKGIRLST